MVDYSRIGDWYHNYVRKVETLPLLEAIEKNTLEWENLMAAIPEEKREYRYAAEKWSIKEMIQHVIDTERVFTYRALCIARGEQQELPSFDENEYAEAANKNPREWNELLAEWRVVRQSMVLLYKSLSTEDFNKNGRAGGYTAYVEGIGYIAVGHTLHHMQILKERYL